MLERIVGLIDENRGDLRKLSDDLWSHPEILYQEKFAVQRCKEYLEARGYELTMPYCGLETAFRCEYGNASGPVFGFCSEYDALPEIGHGCGHNLICAAGLAAFCAVAELLKKDALQGRVVLFGTPAEEGGGGKVKMLEAGCLEGIDAVAMVHPSARTMPDMGSTSNCGLEIKFHGKAAHAAGAPEKGINALDAVQLVFAGVNAYRQHIPEHARFHGVILDGGVAPNIIPDYARCRFYIRSGEESWAPILEKRFRDIVKGAALMTGATAEIAPFRPAYRSRKPNGPMNKVYVDSVKELGMALNIPDHSGRGSSDFGNFSQVRPGIHAYFAISETTEMPGHSVEFRECSGKELGFANAMKAAAALANVGATYLSSPSFRQEVQEDFAKK